MDAWEDAEVAAVLGRAAYTRAAAALVAGIEECEEHRQLHELQKVALVKSLLAHFQGLEAEFAELLKSSRTLESALGAGLTMHQRHDRS